MPDPDPLHELGVFLIALDYRHTALASIALFGAIYLVRSMVAFSNNHEKAWTVSLKSSMGGLVAVFSLYSAVKIASVFLLTKPPAIDQLDGSEIGTVGLVSFAILAGLSIFGIVEFCRRES